MNTRPRSDSQIYEQSIIYASTAATPVLDPASTIAVLRCDDRAASIHNTDPSGGFDQTQAAPAAGRFPAPSPGAGTCGRERGAVVRLRARPLQRHACRD